MCRVHYLMIGTELLVKIAKQISLCFSMQAKPRLIEDEDHRHVLIPNLGELDEK